MDTLLTILSFPLWFIGGILLIVSPFGTISMNGSPMYDQRQYSIRFSLFLLGLFLCLLAYGMTAIAG
jgi:hypothetical protein